ncbi:hypothetical protein QVD17_01825 [Tagetes erecta]|uniref:TF-B3 domain-containing protein n=1 Tax=Tagetes erecta TaxID=13708 RepID=A0AAD8P1U7_TARER|nr:hypothetical protein QVD17_01825 [Tagetes erecta]
MRFHDDDLQTTIKLMRKKLLQIQQKELPAAVMSHKKKKKKKKIINIRSHCDQPSLANNTDVETDSRNARTASHSKTLICDDDFITSIGGSEVELVIEKRLTQSDVNKNHGRLLIPAMKVKNQGFLNDDEKMKLGNKEDVSVLVFDPEKRRWVLNLGKWRMSNEYYVLKTKWNDVVNANELKEGMVMRVFSFRVHDDHKLCFALVLV